MHLSPHFEVRGNDRGWSRGQGSWVAQTLGHFGARMPAQKDHPPPNWGLLHLAFSASDISHLSDPFLPIFFGQ